jgi:glycerate dehydrogenase
MNITVTDSSTLHPKNNSWDSILALGEVVFYDRTEPEQLLTRAKDADVLIVNKTRVRADAFDHLSKLKAIMMSATGYDCVDIEVAGSKGIPVCNVPEYGTDSVAQHVMALLLEMSNRVGLHDMAVNAGEWTAAKDWSFWKTSLFELSGKTIGIVGFGRIGRRVGELAHAFGMRVLAYDRLKTIQPDYQPFSWSSSIADLFKTADVISLHTPLTEELTGFVCTEILRLVKPETILINAARGGLVNDADLATALNEGWLKGAALDTVTIEPIRADNPLLKAKNTVITPHIAWATKEARQRLIEAVAKNILAFLKGEPQNVVNLSYLHSQKS